MFGHNQTDLNSYDNSLQFNNQYFPSYSDTIAPNPTFPPPPLFLPPLSIPGHGHGHDHDTVSALRSEFGYTSSGCSSYGGGSPNSINGTHSPTNLIQRSISSHSLHKNMESYSPLSFYESESSSFRKVLSTGDLQGVNLARYNQRSISSPLANESSIIETMISKACRYSPEEKKERIERYRSKRNLRNFNKKIKYECRKTLADSRPRIRGRFAKNDEVENTPQSQWNTAGAEEDDEEEDNWIHFLDSFSENLMP